MLTASASATTFQSVENEFAIRYTPGRRLILPVAGMRNRPRSALSTFLGSMAALNPPIAFKSRFHVSEW